jgi:hypothetical protein
VPRLRKCGIIPPLLQYVFVPWGVVKHRDNFLCETCKQDVHANRLLAKKPWVCLKGCYHQSVWWNDYIALNRPPDPRLLKQVTSLYKIGLADGYEMLDCLLHQELERGCFAVYSLWWANCIPQCAVNNLQVTASEYVMLPIPCNKVLLEKLMVTQLVKTLSVFFRTRWFITVTTRARNWSLSWARCIQPIPYHPATLRSILILSLHLRLSLLYGLFRSGFPIKIFYAFLISPVPATYPIHPILLDLITLMIFGEKYSYEAPHCAVFSILTLLPPF